VHSIEGPWGDTTRAAIVLPMMLTLHQEGATTIIEIFARIDVGISTRYVRIRYANGVADASIS
jgi:hypothetical protein